jgi:hypothetical protein
MNEAFSKWIMIKEALSELFMGVKTKTQETEPYLIIKDKSIDSMKDRKDPDHTESKIWK